MQFDELKAVMEKRLNDTFAPSRLEIKDQSHLHTGHGATGLHVHVIIGTDTFTGLPLLKRHQLIYTALEGLVGNEIHAIMIKALAPGE